MCILNVKLVSLTAGTNSIEQMRVTYGNSYRLLFNNLRAPADKKKN